MSEHLHIDRGHPDTDRGKTHVLCVGNENTGDGWREVARARNAEDAQRLCDGWNAADELTRLRAEKAELVEALKAADRAFTLHVFSPRGHDKPEDRDTCRVCGGNYRDTRAHITAQEGHPSDVKADAIKRVRTAIAKTKEVTS